MDEKLIPIKSVAEFKRNLKVGNLIGCIRHNDFAGRDETTGQAIYKEKEMPLRKVAIVQSNSFAVETVQNDGKIVNSWCGYPYASFAKIENNRITIFERDTRNFTKGGLMDDSNPDYAALPLMPILTYWLIQP